MNRRDRAFCLWASAAIVLSALIEMCVPGACEPALIAQFWFGITFGLIGLLFWPPSGPDALSTLVSKGRDVWNK